MLKCEEALDKMSDYIDNYLPEQEKIEFENHMKICKSCQQEFDDLEKIILKLKHIEDIEPPDYLKSKIMEKIKLEEKNSKNNILVFKQYYSMAAVLLIFIIGMYISDVSSILSTDNKSNIKLIQQDDNQDINNIEDTSSMQSMARGIITDEESNIASIGNMHSIDAIPANDDYYSIESGAGNINNNFEFFGKTLFKEEELAIYSYKIDFMQGQKNYRISFENTSESNIIFKFTDELGNELLERLVCSGDEIFFDKYGEDFSINYIKDKNKEDSVEGIVQEEFIIQEELEDIDYYIVIELESSVNDVVGSNDSEVLEGIFKIKDI